MHEGPRQTMTLATDGEAVRRFLQSGDPHGTKLSRYRRAAQVESPNFDTSNRSAT